MRKHKKTEYPKEKQRKAKGSNRYLGTRENDFAMFLRERMGEPDYYHKLSDKDKAWIGAFNDFYVQGRIKHSEADIIQDTCTEETKVIPIKNKPGKYSCNDKCYSCSMWRKMWNEQSAAKKDMSSAIKIFPRRVADEIMDDYREFRDKDNGEKE